MAKSKVYFASLRTVNGESLTDKLKRLIKTAGIGEIDFTKQFAAIKLHFGELGNMAFLRPNYAKAVADVVKELGGMPFLTDSNTLYVGTRKHALEHLDTAYTNGFSPYSTGCNIIIADGLKGTDEVLVPVNGGECVKEAKIGRAVMDADVFISLNHFKGHEAASFGGAIKNIGMGCGSRAGKMEMHCEGKPQIREKKCVGCGICAKNCGQDAITFENKKAIINEDKCVGCGRCLGRCPHDAVVPGWDGRVSMLNKKMAEYTKAVLDGRPSFHISLAIDISPFCDCLGCNDTPIVPNIGMFASFDPVALDVACADAVNAQKPNKDSLLGEMFTDEAKDYFITIAPDTDWNVAIDHAVKLGLGSREYEIIDIDKK